MIRLLLARLLANWVRVTALMLGIAAATTAFIVLTGQVAEQRLVLRGRVAAEQSPSYDILVRPQGSRTEIERSQSLVRANFLSGQFGGISEAQWRSIQRLNGVQVAAPVAMIGYLLQSVTIPIDITDRLSTADRQLFTATVRRRTDRGLSTINQPAISYSYVTGNRVSFAGSPADSDYGYVVSEPDGTSPLVCPVRPKSAAGPFDVRTQRIGTCWSRLNGPDGTGFTTLPKGHVGILVSWTFPFLLAAIDPDQEAKLVGLDRAVTSGSYLPEQVRSSASISAGSGVDVLMADHTSLDDTDDLSIQRLSDRAAKLVGNGLSATALDALLDRERGPVVRTARLTAAQAYQQLRRRNLSRTADPVIDSYWTTGSTGYRADADGVLHPRPASDPAGTWRADLDGKGYVTTAPDAAQQAFRSLSRHPVIATGRQEVSGAAPRLATIGTFDESRLDGGSAQALLGGYRTQPLQPADQRSQALLGGQPLLPNSNIAGYLLSAPTMLTSLAQARQFSDPSVFDDVSPAAPISAVKVRVAGVHGTDPVSRERVRLVAEAISRSTGLDVDVTVGSSATVRTVVLPADRYGRPALRLSEQWQRKSVVAAVLRAVDRKSLLLFALVLVVCGLFIANATAAAARSPRTELSTLSCIGWTRDQILGLLLGEVAVLGLAAGLIGALVSLAAAHGLGVQVGLARALAAVPAALGVALLAAAWPVWRASVPVPLPLLIRHGSGRRGAGASSRRDPGSRQLTGLLPLAFANLLRDPGRTGLGVTAVAVGSGALTMLLAITVAFRGSVVGSFLGDALSLQARRVDYLAVLITLLLAALAVADVSYLNMRDRRDDLALLRALGWTDAQLWRLIGAEGLLIGLLGSVVGAGLALAAGTLLAGSVPGMLWLPVGVTVLVATGGSALASTVSALSVARVAKTPLLTGD